MIRLQIMAGKVVFFVTQMMSKILLAAGEMFQSFALFGLASKAYAAGRVMSEEGLAAANRIWGLDMKNLIPDSSGEENQPPGTQKQFSPPAEINVQRMIINQEFKGKADPDRVVASFMKSVTDQATAALSSPGDVPQRA